MNGDRVIPNNSSYSFQLRKSCTIKNGINKSQIKVKDNIKMKDNGIDDIDGCDVPSNIKHKFQSLSNRFIVYYWTENE